MRNFLTCLFILSFLCVNAQTPQRLSLISAIPNVNTGQDYSPWLNDDMNSLVQYTWGNDDPNERYVDVKVKLAQKSTLTKISLYDYEGVFPPDHLTYIYILNGTDSTFVGTFDGSTYMEFIDYPVSNLPADAIVIRKYANDIPQKVQAYGFVTGTSDTTSSGTPERLSVASIIPGEFTGQDYRPWLSDSLDSLVQGTYGNDDPNEKWVDVTLWLNRRSKVTEISLYDFEGIFPSDHKTSIYLKKGNDSTLVGTFDGSAYMEFVDYPVNSILADAVVIHKFGNDIPQKVQIFGIPVPITDSTIRINSTLTFAELAPKTTADKPFTLSATSTNPETPIQFISTDPTVVSVANTAGVWKATILKEGTVTIIAKQAGTNRYIPPMPVLRTLEIAHSDQEPEVVIDFPKIPIDGKRWYTLDNNIDVEVLSDGVASNEVSVVKTGTQRPVFESYYPLRDGEKMTVRAIKMFDGFGSEPDPDKYMHLYVITDTWQRIPIATFNGSEYLSWVGPNPSKPKEFYLDSLVNNARYLLLRGSGMFPTEIELFGDYTAGASPTPAVKKPVKLKDMFAVNGFEWDFQGLDYEITPGKVKAAKTFTGFRHYIEWSKLEEEEGSYTFNPTRSGGWNYDAIYEKCKEEGIEVLGCIKGIPDWMKDTYPASEDGAQDSENVPAKFGKDLTDPQSYLEQGKVAFQYAARYGSNRNVNQSLLSVNGTPRWNFDPINVVKTGMNVVKYMECDNERDKTWKLYGYQTGREYAANLSVFYDGHKNTMGPGVGVKNADPNMKVVMCGIASVETDYVRGMVDWCKEFRGYNPDGTVNLCWDVVNYHAYSNDGKTSQTGTYTRGSAPEVGGLGEVADDFIQMAHEDCKDMEVWVTETGYDLSPGSPLRAIPIGSKTAEQVQADWILRTSLLYARHGVQKVFFYLMYDQSTMDNYTQFATSGLLRNTDLGRKAAGDYIYQTNKLFGEYIFQESLNADPVVDRYQLNGKSMYTLYVPDEKDRKANYTLNLAGMDSAYVYRPQIGKDVMSLQKLKLTNGQLSLQVTETPVFVVGIEARRSNNTYTWTGAISSEPDKPGNWKNAATGVLTELPNETSILTIPGGLSRYPVMNSVYTAKQLTVSAGASWNLNGYNLTITGNLSNKGTISDNNNPLSSITFGGTTAQTYTGNATANSTKVGRIFLDNATGLTLNSGAIDVYDYVKVLKGNLTSNGFLTLKASANGFASILSLPSGSSVKGDVNVEVFFTGGTATYRSNRAISTPINDKLISGTKTYQQLKNFMVITGPGGTANGFDPGGVSQPYAVTLIKYNETASNSQNNYINVSSISEVLAPGYGALLFYRGNRDGYTAATANTSNKVNPPYAIPENTVVKYKGPVNQGTITVPLTYTYFEGEEEQNGFNLVGNPYPCTIDWKLITKNHLNNVFRILKPDGTWATYSEGVTSNAGQVEMRYIQPGQAFYVQASDPTSSSISFTEVCKVGRQAFVDRFMNGPQERNISASAVSVSANQLVRLTLSNSSQTEETVIAFKEGSSARFERAEGDAVYLPTSPFNFSSLTADGKKMTISFMPALDATAEVKLHVNANASGKFTFKPTQLPESGKFKFWLKDNFLNTLQELRLNEGIEISLDKSNSKTYGDDRFVLVTKPDFGTLETTLASSSTTRALVYPNPTENRILITLEPDSEGSIISVYDLSGRLLKESTARQQIATVELSELAASTYIVKVSDSKTRKVISSTKVIKK